jgi:hypothetical protein
MERKENRENINKEKKENILSPVNKEIEKIKEDLANENSELNSSQIQAL